MLTDAYEISDGPVAIRWPKSAPSKSDETGSGLTARQINAGSKVCIIGVGHMLNEAIEASELLSSDGIDATVWDPRVVKPLDESMLKDAADHRLVVTIEDGIVNGGVGAAIAGELSYSECSVLNLGVPTEYIPHGDIGAIRSELGLDAKGIASSVKQRLAELD